MSGKPISLLVFMVFVLSAGALAPAPVMGAGQEPVGPRAGNPLAGASSENVGERAAALIARIAENARTHQIYRDRLAVASAEDSLVLMLQLEGSRDEFIATLKELAAIAPTPGQTAADAASAELRTRVAALLPLITPRIWDRLAELRQEIDGLRARRRATPASQGLELEARISHLNGRVNIIWQYGVDHFRLLEDFHLATPADRETVVQLLSERADDLGGRLDLSVRRMTTLKAANKENPTDTDLKLSMAATKLALDSDATSLGATLDLMDRMGLPTAAGRGKVLAVTRDLASGLLDPAVGATIARQTWQEIKVWSQSHIRRYSVKAALLAAILLLGRLLSVLVRRIVDKSLRRAKFHISVLLRRTLVSSAQAGVFLIAVVIALSQLGISLGPMLAGLGVAGFIVGFALQDSLSNFAAGMMILIYRPYDVGDQVELAGILGKVQHMSMVSTTVLTLDNQKLVVPNNKIWGDVIKNVTDQNVRRVDMTFGISYSDDIDRAESVLNGILEANERVLKQPEPLVRLHKLGESSVDFVVRPWVKTEEYWDLYWEVTRAVKVRFDQERISIPFPQRDVHIRSGAGVEPAGTA